MWISASRSWTDVYFGEFWLFVDYPKLVNIRPVFGTESTVWCGGTIWDYFPVNTGARQGCVLAQIHFSTCMYQVLGRISENSENRISGLRNVVRWSSDHWSWSSANYSANDICGDNRGAVGGTLVSERGSGAAETASYLDGLPLERSDLAEGHLTVKTDTIPLRRQRQRGKRKIPLVYNFARRKIPLVHNFGGSWRGSDWFQWRKPKCG